MRITKVDVIPTRLPFDERIRENMHLDARRENGGRYDYDYYPSVVRMYTDEGLIGLGESDTETSTALRKCLGKSPAEFLHDDSLGGAVIAIYDLVAQAAGVPVSRLFSSSPKERVQQMWWSHCFRPVVLQAETQIALGLGYTVHKIKARPYENLIQQIEAMAEIVPTDYSVIIDPNSSFRNHATTLAIASQLKNFSFVKALEEPIPPADVDGYRTLHDRLPLRLCVHWDKVDTRLFVLQRLCDAFIVEDGLFGAAVLNKVGITDYQGGDRTDYSRQRLWAENGLFTGISQVFQAHQAAALGFEYAISVTHIAENDLIVEPFTLERGFYRIPTKPGLGVTLDEAALDRYRTA
jgi:L-alanine-DL-glutamate epimerase-like enolase superfamily enzyme